MLIFIWKWKFCFLISEETKHPRSQKRQIKYLNTKHANDGNLKAKKIHMGQTTHANIKQHTPEQEASQPAHAHKQEVLHSH